jgi:hypothetical protein
MLFSLAISAFCVTATGAGDACERVLMECVCSARDGDTEGDTVSLTGGTPTGEESAPFFKNEMVGEGDKTFSADVRGQPGMRE